MIEPLAHSRLLQHYSQKPTFGNNTDDSQPMNGLGKCGIYTQWSISQP
jgi:hypothetical protein